MDGVRNSYLTMTFFVESSRQANYMQNTIPILLWHVGVTFLHMEHFTTRMVSGP
jgi:hypothetical protein